MAYTKTNWTNRDPAVPINDANLNKIEEGIRTAHVTADAATSDTTSNAGAIATLQTDVSTLQNDATGIDVNTASITSLEAYFSWRQENGAQVGVDVLDNVDNVQYNYSGALGDGTNAALLPATPTFNDQIRIADNGQNFSAQPMSIRRNGQNIMGLGENLLLNAANDAITLVWGGSIRGWIVVASAN
jgi:hypothetical protein